jgi:hypothetical protein
MTWREEPLANPPCKSLARTARPRKWGCGSSICSKRDGSWSNANGRWWEKEPALVTSYALLSLEMIYRGL